MNRVIKIFSLLLFVVVALASCNRKALSEECACTEKIPIPIDIDWSHSSVDVKNVTILVYNSIDGSLFTEYTYEHNNNDIQSYINLPVGVYTIVIFNELRGQIDYVGCRGYENLETLEFYSKEDDPILTRSEFANYSKQPGDLSLQIIKNVEITDNQHFVDYLKDLRPIKITSTIDITAHVKGLNNARMPALADLKNLSHGYMVHRDKNTTSSSHIQFNLNDRTYDNGSTKDGIISASITTFGTLGTRGSVADHKPNTPIELDILFMLVDKDKTIENRVIDVTKIITSTNHNHMGINYSIYVEFNNALTNVTPEGSSNSGFNADAEDWDSVDIPLQQ